MKKKDHHPHTALVAPAAVPSEIPAYLHSSGRGFENTEQADLIVPRVKLLQPLSPEVQEEGQEPGHLVNSVTKRDYGITLTFIPVMHFKTRIRWASREPGSGLHCASDNGREIRTGVPHPYGNPEGGCLGCPEADWNEDAKDEKDKQPRCTLFYAFPSLVEGDDAPAAISMERTKVQAAKKLLSLARYAGAGLDMFARKYRLESVLKKSGKYTYYTLDVNVLGYVTEAEFARAENLYASITASRVRLDLAEQDHVGAASD